MTDTFPRGTGGSIGFHRENKKVGRTFMEIRMGTEQDRNRLLKAYPYTSQVIGEIGDQSYLVVAAEPTDPQEILGFAFVFRREIPAPVEKTEDFIGAIEVFAPANRKYGIGSAIVGQCIRLAKSSGSYQVRAYCDIHNLPSHRLWLKCRFGISPVKMPDGTIPGSFVTYIL